jgi:hypothetical protein
LQINFLLGGEVYFWIFSAIWIQSSIKNLVAWRENPQKNGENIAFGKQK